MSNDYRTYHHPRGRDTLDRFLAYLRTRRAETWAFFAAGLVTGLFLG